MRVLIILLLIQLGLGTANAQTLFQMGQQDPDALPDAQVSRGSKDIASAWLIDPTTRYTHFVRGQNYEAGGLRVQLSNGQVLTLRLEKQFVFEDRTARLADLDGDGRDEIIVVLTSAQKGAALAAYGVEEGELVLKARTPFIGLSFRWLNPAGIADFNGDGQLDVALVQKPHLSKVLEFWTLENGEFIRIVRVDNVSNHRNGSPFTKLSAVADFDKNGLSDLATLSANYSNLRIFGFTNGRLKEISSTSLPAEGIGNFELKENTLIIPLANGEKFELNF